MSILFSPLKIGNLTIKNRFMRSATYEGLGNPDGTPKPKLLRAIEQLANGEVGLIVPGYVYPMESGKAAHYQCALYLDKHAQSWKSTIEYVHKTGSKIVFQICHGGMNVVQGLEPISPTTIRNRSREVTISEVEDIIEAFRRSAVLAHKAGADGVQIHAAHGYLFSAFLSPLYNKRSDQYGGSPEKQARVINEIADTIKSTLGKDFPIYIKMNGSDFLPFGTNPDLASKYVNILKKNIDMFEISCGYQVTNATIRPNKLSFKDRFLFGIKNEEGYNLKYAQYIKKKNPNTIIASVGGFNHSSFMENALEMGMADIISMSRPFIREPNLVTTLQLRKAEQSACIRCNDCLHTVISRNQLACTYP